MNSPNLFNYATKELSQDAMICWLIAFAGMQSVRNPAEVELRQCGRELLNALFSKWQFTPTVYERVEVFQQEKHIDVLVRINERHVLLIEDKTLTRDHDDQLTRYRNLVTEGKTLLRNVNTDEVFPIYFKTGNHSLREREYAKSCNYRVFDRNDFLSVLESYQGNNEIFVDFRNHLKNWQLETENFRQWTSKGEKTDRGWQGLYRWIEENYLVGCNDNWGPLGSRNEGFIGNWIEPTATSENSRFAIWIERDKIGFRLFGSKNKPCAEGMNHEKQYWADAFVENGSGRFTSPGRLDATRTKPMCVAQWRGWLVFGDNGLLDLTASLKNLKDAREILVTTIQQ